MKNKRQSKEKRKSSRVLAVLMALMMITALILPIGAKASETSDGSASGASQAVAEEYTKKDEEKDSSHCDGEKEEEKEKADSAENQEKEQESDSSADAASEDSSDAKTESKDSESKDSGSKDTESKVEGSDSDQTSGKNASNKDSSNKDTSNFEGDKGAEKDSTADQRDSGNTDASKDEEDETDAASPTMDTSSGKSGQAETSEETAEQVTAEQKDDDSTITFRTEEVTVIADKKAFDTEVTMKVKKVTDPEQLLKMVTALQEEGGSYTVKAYNVSFYDKKGKEVEPKIPVQVNVNTKVSAPKKTKVVHVKDDDKTEILDADIDRSGASFELGSFSDIGVATEGKAKIPGSSFDIYLGGELTTEYRVEDLPAGPISEKDLPAVDGYTYENATVGDDQVEELGTITDEDGNVYVYYTTKDEKGMIRAEILGDGRIRINLVETEKDTSYDLTVGDVRVTVTAPAGAFEPGTEMHLEKVTDPETLLLMVSALEKGKVYNLFAVDISFWKDGVEVEPKDGYTVDVVMESEQITADSQFVHLENDDTPVLISAESDKGKAAFSLNSFSAVGASAIEQDYVLADAINITGAGSNNGTPSANLTPGVPAAIAPEFDGYVFVNATAPDSTGMDVVEVTYVGCFISEDIVYTYYRTATDQNDLIVHVENGEKIHFNYEDINNIYNIHYEITGDTSDTSVDEVFGTDRKEQAVKNSTEVGYTVNIPRGYYATVYRGNTAVGTLGLDSSTTPQGITYSVSNDKVITKTGNLTLSGTYSIPAATSTDQTIRVALSKRNSYIFDASKFLSTVYTGGNSTTMGDDAVNTNANARITGDGSLGRSGTNKGKKTFDASDNGATVSWSFETNTTETSTWLMDALEINGTTIEVPYAADTTGTVGESKTTTLPSGTVVTVSLDSMRRASNGRYQRTYTISVSNCFEDIVISGGNIYNSNNSTEIIPEVLDNVSYQFYGYSSSDNAYTYAGNSSYLKWQDWGVGEPIAVGESNGNQSTAQSRNYNMYGYNQGDRQSMRFQVAKGYVNPQIAFVTSTETDLISNVTGISRGTKKDGYYPITSDPYNDRYYYFKITGMGNNKLALLRIKADLGQYGVKYSAGTGGGTPITPAEGTLPEAVYDEYNVETNPQIVLSSVVPKDSAENYIFQYWTIDGDTKHYAPGQVIDLQDVCDYAVKDNEGRLYIPLTANWVSREQAEQISYVVEFWIEDEESVAKSYDMQAPKGSAIYVNKDSEHIADFIESYDNLLEYDEAGSATYVASVDQGDVVQLRFKWIRYPVTITKSVVSVFETDKTRDFSFNSTLSHKFNPTAPGVTAVSLQNGQTKNIKEIINTSEHEVRKASKLTLVETGIDGFDVSYNVKIYEDNGTEVKETKTVTDAELSSLEITGKTEITVTNTRMTANVTIKKLVEGNMADTSKSFTFNYSIDGTAGTAFDLSNGEEKAIENVPIGSTIVITETDADEYTTTVTAVDGSNNAVSGSYHGNSRSYTLTVPQNGGTVTFTNTKTAVAPTQLYSGTGPMAVLVVFSLGALILLAAHHFIDRFRNNKM